MAKEDIKCFKEHRHESKPQEKLLHDKFKSEHMGVDMDFIVFPPANDTQTRPTDHLSDREKSIVLSTIQWLGSPVGQGFLHSVGFELKRD